ncbi:MAG TPA: hypothetical protein VK348_06010, partial [Planctomycetota bacterium]|nr:hypothetical protein [Planctomycetota bacterium]
MNRLQLFRAVDELATCAPERQGYGFSDTQYAWHHDPAIEQPRQVFQQLLEVLRQAGLCGTHVQIGLGRHGGSHRALRLLAERVVSVEADAARVAAFATSGEV